MLEVCRAGGDAARGIVSVRSDITETELAGMHKAGVRGVRFNFVKRLVDATPKADFLRITDKIKDFGRGADQIEIKAGAVDQFSDLTIEYTGDDALISYAGTRIKVLDVGQNGLDAGDFIF